MQTTMYLLFTLNRLTDNDSDNDIKNRDKVIAELLFIHY